MSSMIVLPMYKEKTPKQLWMLKMACEGAKAQGVPVTVFYHSFTPDVAKKLVEKYNFYEYVVVPSDVKSALDKHVYMHKYADADFIAINQSDDIFLPDKIKIQTETMNKESLPAKVKLKRCI